MGCVHNNIYIYCQPYILSELYTNDEPRPQNKLILLSSIVIYDFAEIPLKTQHSNTLLVIK